MRMATIMKVDGRMIRQMDKERMFMQMVQNILEPGKMISKMETGLRLGLMALVIRDVM